MFLAHTALYAKQKDIQTCVRSLVNSFAMTQFASQRALSLFFKHKNVWNVLGSDDNDSYEVLHFLSVGGYMLPLQQLTTHVCVFLPQGLLLCLSCLEAVSESCKEAEDETIWFTVEWHFLKDFKLICGWESGTRGTDQWGKCCVPSSPKMLRSPLRHNKLRYNHTHTTVWKPPQSRLSVTLLPKTPFVPHSDISCYTFCAGSVIQEIETSPLFGPVGAVELLEFTYIQVSEPLNSQIYW